MINKNNLWFLTLFSLVLILSIYYITMPSELLSTENDKSTKKTAKVETNEVDLISALRLEDESSGEEEVNKLKETLSNAKATVEEKNTAFEELKRVNGKQAKEEMIEEKLKTELKLDTFVKVEGDQIRVVVGSKEHSASLANEVMRLIQELFDSKMYISVQFQN